MFSPCGGKLLLDLAVNRGCRGVGVGLICRSKRPLNTSYGQGPPLNPRVSGGRIGTHFSAPNDMRSEGQIIIHVMHYVMQLERTQELLGRDKMLNLLVNARYKTP